MRRITVLTLAAVILMSVAVGAVTAQDEIDPGDRVFHGDDRTLELNASEFPDADDFTDFNTTDDEPLEVEPVPWGLNAGAAGTFYPDGDDALTDQRILLRSPTPLRLNLYDEDEERMMSGEEVEVGDNVTVAIEYTDGFEDAGHEFGLAAYEEVTDVSDEFEDQKTVRGGDEDYNQTWEINTTRSGDFDIGTEPGDSVFDKDNYSAEFDALQLVSVAEPEPDLVLDADQAYQGERVGYEVENLSTGDHVAVSVNVSALRGPEMFADHRKAFRLDDDAVERGVIVNDSDDGPGTEIGSYTFDDVSGDGEEFEDVHGADATIEGVYAVLEEDSGATSRVATRHLDDGSVDVRLTDSASDTEGALAELASDDPADTESLDVLQAEVTSDEPDEYVVDEETDVNGTTTPMVFDVAVYARDDGSYLHVMNVSVIAGEYEAEDIVLSDDETWGPGSEILQEAGTYSFGAIDQYDAEVVQSESTGDVYGDRGITSAEFDEAASDSSSLEVFDIDTEIDECGVTIDEPGSYEVVDDLSSSETCIEVTTSDVHVDGGGHNLSGVDPDEAFGFHVNGSEIQAENVTVYDVELHGWSIGAVYEEAPMGEMENVTVQENDDLGVYLDNSDGMALDGSEINANSAGGVLVMSSDATRLHDNVFYGNGMGARVESDDVEVTENDFLNHSIGVFVQGPTGTVVEGNYVEDADDAGILAGSTGDADITDNTVVEVDGPGVRLGAPTADIDVLNNTVVDSQSGVQVEGSDGHNLSENVFVNNTETGVYLNETTDTEVSFNYVEGGFGGVVLEDSPDNPVEFNTVTETDEAGVAIVGRSHGNTLVGNDASGNDGHGFMLEGAATEDDPGPTDNTLVGNIANDNDLAGVFLETNASENVIRDQTANRNSAGVVITEGSTDNLVDDGVAHDNDDVAAGMDDGSTDNVFVDLDVGTSTADNTTMSFTGEEVSVGANETPANNPDSVSIDRYFEAESLGGDSYLEVSLQYDDADVDGVVEDDLAVWRHETGDDWTELPSEVDAAENTVSANVTEFSTFGAFAEPDTDFQVEITSVNEPIDEGDSLEVEAEITNEGEDGTEEVALGILDQYAETVTPGVQYQLDSVEGTLRFEVVDPDKSDAVRVIGPGEAINEDPEEGDYFVVDADGEVESEGFDEVRLNKVCGEAYAAVSEYYGDETAVHAYEVEEDSPGCAEEQIYEVEYRHPGKVVDSIDLTLDSDESSTETFTWDTEMGEASEYSAIVSNVDDSDSLRFNLAWTGEACGGRITQSGLHEVQNDLESSETCIEVVADDVEIDGAGHSITAVDPDYDAIGIHAMHVDGLVVDDVVVEGWDEESGIYLDTVVNAEVTGSELRDNSLGVLVDSGSSVEVTDNDISGHSIGVMDWSGSEDTTVAGNTFTDDSIAIYSAFVESSTYEANEITGSTIDIDSSEGVEVLDNELQHGSIGLRVSEGTTDSLLENNTLESYDVGLYLRDTSGNTALDNQVFDSDNAAQLENASDEVDSLDIGASTEDNTTLSFTADNVSVSAVDDPPENPDATSIHRYFDAEPVGASPYLDVDLQYDDADVDDVFEATLGLWRYDGADWRDDVESTLDEEENTVSANLTSFSTFGAFAEEPEPPHFDVEAVDHDDQALEGLEVNVTVDVENTGDLEGTQNVTLDVDGEGEADREELTLAGGDDATTTLSWNTSQNDEGTHQLTASSDNSSETVETEVASGLIATVHSYSGSVYRADGLYVDGYSSQREVNIVAVDEDGNTMSEQTTTDVEDHSIDEEALPLQDGGGDDLETGSLDTAVFSPGEDGVYGDGTIDYEGDGRVSDPDNFTEFAHELDEDHDLGQSEITEVLLDESVEDEDSDDYLVADSFQLEDNSTTSLDDADPDPVMQGDSVELWGTTNRNPDQTTLAVEAVDGPEDGVAAFPSETTGDWGFDGVWSVEMEVSGDVDVGEYVVQVEDDVTNDNYTLTVEEPAPAVFDVGISTTNEPVTEGETLSVSASVENTGGEPDTQTVELSIDGDTVDSDAVSLDAGGSTTTSLVWNTGEGDAGSYDAVVSSEDDSATTEVSVEEQTVQPSPDFGGGFGGGGGGSLGSAEFLPSSISTSVEGADGASVDLEVENVGGSEDTVTVELRADGDVVDDERLRLIPYQSEAVSLSTSEARASYSVIVDGEEVRTFDQNLEGTDDADDQMDSDDEQVDDDQGDGEADEEISDDDAEPVEADDGFPMPGFTLAAAVAAFLVYGWRRAR